MCIMHMVLKCESSEIEGIPVIKSPHWLFLYMYGVKLQRQILSTSVLNCWRSYPPKVFLRKWSESHMCHFLPLLFLIQALAHKNCVHRNLVVITQYLHHFLWADFPRLMAVCCQWHFAVQIDQRHQWPLVPVYVQGHFYESCVSCHCCQFKMWYMVGITNIFWGKLDSSLWYIMCKVHGDMSLLYTVGSSQAKLFRNKTNCFLL